MRRVLCEEAGTITSREGRTRACIVKYERAGADFRLTAAVPLYRSSSQARGGVVVTGYAVASRSVTVPAPSSPSEAASVAAGARAWAVEQCRELVDSAPGGVPRPTTTRF